MNINGNLKFLGLGELQNARVENLATDPGSPAVGQIWYNTTDLVYRGYNGTAVITFATGGSTAALQTEIDAIETAVGLNTDGTLAAFTGTNYLNAVSTIKAGLVALDTATKAAADAVAAEVTRAEAAEAAIAADVATEVTDRTTADTALGVRVDGVEADLATEVTDRTTADTALGVRIDGVEADLATEVTDRTNADTALQTAVDGKVSKAGDSMSGNLAMNGNKVTGLANPDAGTDAATKIYVDNKVVGLSWKAPVAQALADHTAAAGVVVDDRVADLTDGKIYTVVSLEPTVFDAGVVLVDGDAFFNKADETGYVYSGTAIVQFTGGGQITAGVGLVKTGNQLDVNLGAGIAQLPTDEVGVDLLGTGGLFLTVDGTAASTDGAAQVAVKLDGTTLARSANGVKVSDATIATITAAADAITAEVTRATTAEDALQDAIDGLVTDLAAEVTRATTAEGTLTTNLAAEVTRATTAEDALQDAIDAEVTARGTAVGAVNTRIEAGFYVYTSGAAATSHTVTHNIGSKYNNVTVVDSADEVVIPQSVKFDTTSQLTVTFNTAITCKVIVSGLNPLV